MHLTEEATFAAICLLGDWMLADTWLAQYGRQIRPDFRLFAYCEAIEHVISTVIAFFRVFTNCRFLFIQHSSPSLLIAVAPHFAHMFAVALPFGCLLHTAWLGSNASGSCECCSS